MAYLPTLHTLEVLAWEYAWLCIPCAGRFAAFANYLLGKTEHEGTEHPHKKSALDKIGKRGRREGG